MKQYKRYTLVEIMVVMALAAVLVTISLPAFSALMRGNSAAIASSTIKGVFDQAQARAINDRKYVATVIDVTNDSQALRNCYVKPGTYVFQSWVEGSDWVKLDGDAKILMSALGEAGTKFQFPSGGVAPALGGLQDITGITGASAAARPGVVFTMYGSVKVPNGNFFIGVGEAAQMNNAYIYKNVTDGGQPGNAMVLTVNHFTGRSQVASLDIVSESGTEKRKIVE